MKKFQVTPQVYNVHPVQVSMSSEGTGQGLALLEGGRQRRCTSEMSASVPATLADPRVPGMVARSHEHTLGVEGFCPRMHRCSAEQEAVWPGY